MESPHREVGLFAVRLLWERQRRKFALSPQSPSHLVPPYALTLPHKGGGDGELRQFLRKTLFGLLPKSDTGMAGS